MGEDQVNPVKTAEELRGKPFQKGDDPRRNTAGRPVGSLDFKTKWFKFIEKVAESNGMTPEEIDEQLFAVGFKKAKEGDYQFYKDIHDRVHGKPLQSIDHTSDGERIQSVNVTVHATRATIDSGVREESPEQGED
jgi:hypothetical protein